MDTTDLQVWCDGSATYLPNDGRPMNGANARCHSMYSLWAGKTCLEENSVDLGYGTINQSEFIGVILGIKAALGYSPKKLTVYSDSRIVVNAVNNLKLDCAVHGASDWIPAIWNSVRNIEHFNLVWIPRDKNRSDGLNRKLAKEKSKQP